MNEALHHAEHERLAAALRQSQRQRFSQAQLWDHFRQHCPALASRSDQRHALLETLTTLAQANVLRLPAESRWDHSLPPPLPLSADVLGGLLPSALSQHAWLPRMAFAASVRNPTTRTALAEINRYLRDRPSLLPTVPLRERSLHIYGDEKRLEGFVSNGSLFGGALTFSDLGIYQPAVPLANEAQPSAVGAPLLVLENHHSYESFRAWNARTRVFSAVVFGAGNSLSASTAALSLLADAYGAKSILYFGDIDPEGLLILARVQAALPGRIRPHYNFYRWLLRYGKRAPLMALIRGNPETMFAEWPLPLANEVRLLWAGAQRIAQENFGSRELAALSPTEATHKDPRKWQ